MSWGTAAALRDHRRRHGRASSRAIKLREAGYDDFTIYEKADRLGGTWRENTYPGLACDVPSHLYSYSFAPNPEWSHRFSPGAEIQAYFEGVAREHGVERAHPLRRRGRRAASSRDGRWQLETKSGHRDEVDVVIAATGVLHHPNATRTSRASTTSRARCFHSARWDHDVRARRPARRRHRHRLDGGADRRRRSSTASRSSRSSSAPRSGSCRRRTRPTPRRRRPRSARHPEHDAPAARATCRSCSRELRERGRRRRARRR